jgi:hypothetical protein
MTNIVGYPPTPLKLLHMGEVQKGDNTPLPQKLLRYARERLNSGV